MEMTTFKVAPSTLALIKSALDAQLTSLKLRGETIEEDRQHLATLKIEGLALDRWDEFTLDVAKLRKWAETWEASEMIELELVDDNVPTYRTDKLAAAGWNSCRDGHYTGCQHEYTPSWRLRLSRGESLIQFNLIQSVAEGVEPITLPVMDGVIQPPSMPAKIDVQREKRLLSLKRKGEVLLKRFYKVERELEWAEQALAKAQGEYELACAETSKPVTMEALIERALEVRDARRKHRYLEAFFNNELSVQVPDDLMEGEWASWFTDAHREGYVREWQRYDAFYRKWDTYSPKRSWSSNASKETSKRKIKVQQQRAHLERYTMACFAEYLQATVGFGQYDLGYDYSSQSFQHHRKVLRHWPRVERELRNEVEALALDKERIEGEMQQVREITRELKEVEGDVVSQSN